MKTNKLKKLLSIMVILAICIVSITAIACATPQKGEITSGGDVVLNRYVYHSELIVPARHFSQDGQNFPARSTVTFPSGEKTTFTKIVLDEVGTYNVTYNANVNGEEKTESYDFVVKASPADLWDTSVMVKPSNVANVPEYEGKGAVLLSAHERAEARYVNPVYIGDNKSSDDLMTFIVAPTNLGQAEFESFYIVVEDYENASNRLYIRFTRGFHELTREKYNTTITISTDGKTWLGTDGKQYNFENNSIANAAYITGSGFYGRLNDGSPSAPIRVSLDATKKTVTVSCKDSLTFDLTDEKVVGVNKAWKGIDSGLAYVYAGFMERLTSAPASVAIYTLDGVSMAGEEISASKAPTVIVDDSAFENEIVAKKGVKHTFLGAQAIDVVAGGLDYKTSVYKLKDDVLESIPSYYDGFTPTESGEYYVEYVSEQNVAGVNGVSGYYLNVLEPEDCEITFDFGSLVDSVKAGSVINIPEYDANGGVGKINVVYSAKIGDKVVEVEEGSMIPEYVGELVLTATCTDVIQTMTFTETITVIANDEVYFDLGYIPSTILTGDVLDLTNAKAYRFGANGREELDMAISFADSVVSGKKVTPVATQVGEKQLVITAGEQVKSFNITVRTPENAGDNPELKMIKNYFTLTSGEILPSTDCVYFVSTLDTKIEFLREIDKDFFSVKFNAKASNANFDYLTFTLYDTLDATNFVTFDVHNRLVQHSDEHSVLTYAGEEYDIYGSFFDQDGIAFKVDYDAATNSIVDIKGNTVMTLTKRADGKTFNGFKGNIRFAIDVCEVEGTSKLELISIGNQLLDSSVTNYNNGPEIKFLEQFAPAQTGTEYVIPAFKAYDVLNNFYKASISVKDASKKEVYKSSDMSAFKFTPETSGEYTITIKLYDDKDNSSTKTTKVNVIVAGSIDFVIGGVNVSTTETIAPTVSINAKPTVKVNVGEEFNIAKLTVTDDKTELKDIKLYAYVVAPSGVRTLLCSTPEKMEQSDQVSAEQKLAMFTDANAKHISYTANKAGKYVIYYVVRDADGLTTIVHYTVEVVANNG